MQLEHINLRVPSIAKTQEFLAAAFPDFRVRGSGYSPTYGCWSHFGNDDYYLALLQAEKPGSESPRPIEPFDYDDAYRLMHVGLVVEDVEELMQRLEQRGYEPDQTGDLDSNPHRRRVYYLDDNGMEWEFVQYLSDKPSEKNDYSL